MTSPIAAMIDAAVTACRGEMYGRQPTHIELGRREQRLLRKALEHAENRGEDRWAAGHRITRGLAVVTVDRVAWCRAVERLQ